MVSKSALLPDLAKYEKCIDLTAGRLHYYELGSGTNNILLVLGLVSDFLKE